MSGPNEKYFLIILVSVVMLLLVTGYFVYTIIYQQRKIVKWQQARIRAEIELLENERKRIASDLHDEIGPMLSAVKLQINHLEPLEETELAALEKSSEQIDTVIQRFRDISYNLLPNTLVRKGLITAVEEFIYRVKPPEGLLISFTADAIDFPKESEINLFRIIQEIVHNTIKHARASTLVVELRQRGSSVILKTTDNGIGFTYEEKMHYANGLGLLNLQSRVEVLRGRLKIQTEQGKGTIYIIEIPHN